MAGLLRRLRGKRGTSACGDVLARGLGHALSQSRRECVDAAGRPIPWYTYPAIEFLEQLDFRDRQVFEFGCGNSTLFWGARAARVTSVEHDPAWHASMSAKVESAPIDLRLAAERTEYVAAIRPLAGTFDVIVVDGRWRFACAREAVAALRPGGLIVLDNADWYPGTARMLRAANLIEIDFSGFGPINDYTWTTSLFLDRAYNFRPRSDRQPVPGIGSLPDSSPDDDPDYAGP